VPLPAIGHHNSAVEVACLQYLQLHRKSPAANETAMPSGPSPRPLMWVWVATRWDFVVEVTSSILRAI